MNILWGFTATKKILKFEINKETSSIFIRACPASLFGIIASFFVRNNLTTIKINSNLFISDEWGFFKRKIMYIPVRSITSISMRERFRTFLLFLSIVSFALSILFIYTGISLSIIQKLQFVFFALGIIFSILAFWLKQKVYVTIYRGNHTHDLNFRVNQKDLVQLKEMLEMIMFFSTGQRKRYVDEDDSDKNAIKGAITDIEKELLEKKKIKSSNKKNKNKKR